MSARSRMTHRCKLLRMVGSGSRNGYNQPIKSLQQLEKALPCYWQVRLVGNRPLVVQDDDKFLSVTVHHMMFPANANVEELDVVENVRPLRGKVLHEGKLHVQTVYPKDGFKAAILREYH